MPIGKAVRSLFAMLFLITIILSGCWDRQEINQIGFAVGLGIDKDGEDYVVTTQLALPSMLEGGGGGEEPPVWVVGGKGRTIFEAIRDVNTRSARRPFWGHLNVIVIGEDVAKDGLIPVIDLLSRGRELRRSNYIVIAEGKARDILQAAPKLESINAIFISQLIENRTGQSVAPGVTLNDLLITLDSPGREPVLPKISALEQESFMPPKKEKEAPEEGKEEKPKEILELRGSGIFKKDKLLGWMDEETTRGYLWSRGEVQGGILVVKNPLQPKGNISLEIKSNKSSISPAYSNGEITIGIKVESSLNLVENTGSVGVDRREHIKRVSREAAEAIRKEVNKAIEKAQEKETDILGLGERVRTSLPHVWEQMEWSEIFPRIDVIVEVHTTVQEAAMTLKPVHKK
ncbi:MAG: Ger(x)C family spore germination protein [Bacillota bacterium]